MLNIVLNIYYDQCWKLLFWVKTSFFFFTWWIESSNKKLLHILLNRFIASKNILISYKKSIKVYVYIKVQFI